MSNDFKARVKPGALTTIYDCSRRGPEENVPDPPKYNIIALHGTGDSSTSKWASAGGVAWLKDLLPLHISDSRIQIYDFAMSNGQGLRTEDISLVASKLLDQLSLQDISHIVFIGHGIGGIIIKKALSMAIGAQKYAQIATKTSLLVFFNTPHRAPKPDSWEALGNWLCLVSEKSFKLSGQVSAILTIARMLKEVNAGFKSLERVYQAVNIFAPSDDSIPMQHIDSYSTKMGLPDELNLERKGKHEDICKFSDSTDEIFQRICSRITNTSGLHKDYVQCLAALSGLFNLDQGTTEVDLLPTQTESALQQCRQQIAYETWSKAQRGVLYLYGRSHPVLPYLSSITEPDGNSRTETISFSFDFGDDRHDDEFEMAASLCYQILCLDPSVFRSVSELYHVILEAGSWRGESLWVFLRSLLECPRERQILCLISRIIDHRYDPKRGSNTQRIVDQVMSLSQCQPARAKFIIVSNEMSAAPPSSIIIDVDQVVPNYSDLELDCLVTTQVSELLLRRPEFAFMREDIETSLRMRCKDDQLMDGTLALEGVKFTLKLLHNSTSWTTKTSLRDELNMISCDLGNIYKETLFRIPLQDTLWARRCLSWITRSFREFQLSELAVALATREDMNSPTILDDEMSLNLKRDIGRVLGNVVRIRNNKVGIATSLRNYLLDSSSNSAPFALHESYLCDSHAVIATKCLAYIAHLQSISKASEEPLSVYGDKRYDLLEYALQYWALHYDAASKDMRCGVLESLVENQELMQYWSRLYGKHRVHRPGKRQVASPLLIAVELRCHGLFEKLIGSIKDNGDQLINALELAIQLGDDEIVTILTNGYGVGSPSALHIAASFGQSRLVRMFIQQKGLILENDPGLTPLQRACKSGSLATVEELLSAGADASASSAGGITSLHIASQFGHVQILSRLLSEADIDRNAVDDTGATALHLACRFQQPESVSCLLSSKEQPKMDVADKEGNTLLHLIAMSGRCDILELLLGVSAFPATDLLSRSNNRDMQPLHISAQGGHLKILEKLLPLLEGVWRITDAAPEGIALHLAVKQGHVDVVNALTGVDGGESQITQRDKFGSCPLHLAVRGGNVDIVTRIVGLHRSNDKTLDLFEHKDDYETPLHLASSGGNIEITQSLLDANATPDILDSQDRTPLLLACWKGFRRVASLLLERGADPNLRDCRGFSPIKAAAEMGHFTIVKILLKAIGDEAALTIERDKVLHSAAKGGHLGIFRLILEQHTETSQPWIEQLDDENRTPLQVASSEGQLEVVRDLLKLNADPTRASEHPKTEEVAGAMYKALLKHNFENDGDRKEALIKLLSHCAIENYPEPINEMIHGETNAIVTPQDITERSLIHLAAQNGHLNLVKLLVQFPGVAIDGKNNFDRTPASSAAEKGQLEIVRFLLEEHGAEINSTDATGRTPLSYAAGYGHQSLVDDLLQRMVALGVPTDQDKKNRSPLWYASRYGHENSVRSLLRGSSYHGSVQDTVKHWTCLHAAAKGNHPNVVKELLESGAACDKDTTDKLGRTPIFTAAYYGYDAVVKELIASKATSDKPDMYGWGPIHAAYDAPVVVKLLLDEDMDQIHRETDTGETMLHMAVSCDQEDTVELLVKCHANTLAANQAGFTPLHLAVTDSQNDNILRLLLPDAKRRGLESGIDLAQMGGDSVDTDIFRQAIIKNRPNALRMLLEEKVAATNSIIMSIKRFFNEPDIERENEVSFVLIDWLLSISSDPEPKISLDRDEHHQIVREITIKLIEKRQRPTEFEDLVKDVLGRRFRSINLLASAGQQLSNEQFEQLFKVATTHDNIPLCEWLVQQRPDLQSQKDEHGWTLPQIIHAFQPIEGVKHASLAKSHVFPENIPSPKCWSPTGKSNSLRFVEDDRNLTIEYFEERHQDWYTEAASIRADEPIHPFKEFYFEVEILKGGDDQIVGIGFGHKSFEADTMPGWRTTSWGLHGDDGGLFHLESVWDSATSCSEERTFGITQAIDKVGCRINPCEGTAYFTRNGKLLDGKFTGITGRIFPMVGMRSVGAKVRVHFPDQHGTNSD